MRVIALLALCFAAVAAGPTNPQRIVGGTLTTIDKYPIMAALLYSPIAYGHRHACGGSIVTKNAVLTAAHCTYGDAIIRWRVRVGSNYANSGGTVFDTEAITNHPQYNTRIYNNDIALLRVNGTFSFNNNVKPASIAGPNYHLADNQIVWATGWGTISPGGLLSEQLRHVQIWTVNQQICATRYAAIRLTVTDNMLCSGWLDVGGRDQCQGDSGGPLFHNGVVVGICSWGQSCALADFPGVNTRVSRYTSWLQNNV